MTRIITYNVNGIRAAIKKGFMEWVEAAQPDIVCLQETKAQPDQIPVVEFEMMGYRSFLFSAKKKGYSGVALYSKKKPKSVQIGLGIAEYDREGRTIVADYEDFVLIVAYFPNGSRDHSRVPFKMAYKANFLCFCNDLRASGRPVIFCGDYLEPHPLGKAEWIRFLSLFYNLEERADRFFQEIDSVYNSYKSLTEQTKNRPLVLTGLPWKDTWYMAGGESFAATLIKDAGGEYLWADSHSAEAIPLDLESVYARAVKAEIWINPGAATSLNELQNFDQRFTELGVIQSGMIFNNNERLNTTGGNDYWESGTVRPDLVLADLIKVFHPDLLTDHRLFYYRQLK